MCVCMCVCVCVCVCVLNIEITVREYLLDSDVGTNLFVVINK